MSALTLYGMASTGRTTENYECFKPNQENKLYVQFIRKTNK